MSFEQKLRDQLRREAASVPLPDREPAVAVGRARARRRHRRLAATGATVVAALAVAVPTIVRDDDGDGSVTTGTPAASGLMPTGPLDLEWRRAEDGLYDARSAFQDGDVVYALSTGPGVRTADYPNGDYPRALYRLGEDGTWEPVTLDGDRPRAFDVSGAGGLLYAVSTGPAGGSGDAVAHLSTSADAGETWTSEDVPAPAPPSTAVDWQVTTDTAVESISSTTLAIVTTTFEPDYEALFEEMASSDAYAVETRDEGLVLVRYPQVDEPAAETTPPSTAPPEGDAGTDGVEVQRDAVEANPAEEVRTIPWSDLGIDGPEALAPHHQLFRRAGDVWEPIDGADAFAGLTQLSIDTAGDRFIVSGAVVGGSSSEVLTSADGASWSPVTPAPEAQVVGVGSALVQLPWDTTVIQVSGDAGATWSDVDLAEVAGVDPGSAVVGGDGGPLGLALVVANGDGTNRQLVVSGDLVDWTVTPLTDIVGAMEDLGSVTPIVGEDRIVVTATEPTDTSEEPAASVTAVGTPIR